MDTFAPSNSRRPRELVLMAWYLLKVGTSKVRNGTKGNAGAFDSPKRVEWDSKDFHAASCCIARSRAGQPEISFVQRRSRKSAQSAY